MLLHFTNKVLFAPTSYDKMFGSDKRLIQFFLSLYPMLIYPQTPLNLLEINQGHNQDFEKGLSAPSEAQRTRRGYNCAGGQSPPPL